MKRFWVKIASFLLLLMGLVGCQKSHDVMCQEIVLHLDDEGKFTVDTKATAVTALPSSLYWGMTYSNGTVKQATTSKSVSSSKISTGYYQTASPTTYVHYVSNVNFTAGGTMTVANNGTDVIVGKSSSSSTTPFVTLNHIFARTGTLTCNTQSGYTISGVSWTITSYGSTTGTAGTYNVSSESWTARSAALSETSINSSSDLYLIPGEYTIKVSYTLSKGDYSQSFTKSGRVTLSAGNVNNITCTASGGTAQEIVISVSLTAWTTRQLSFVWPE